jgi:cyclopropane fatty-acyl-phospholipid synthase-like methyltransferase
MRLSEELAENCPHGGGNKNFWRNERVDNYDAIQTVLSEKKAEEQKNIVRIIRYFCDNRQITNPTILDIGCGPGTPITIVRDILEKIPECTLIGADGSEEMVAKANANLTSIFGGRFTGIVSDFNSDRFWASQTNQKYDFIVSSSALHYLSDQRRKPFFREVFEHLNDKGVFIAGIACCETNSDIGEMEQIFRFEYTYNKMKELGRATDFAEFKRSAEATDAKAKINWQSPDIWLSAIRGAGFSSAGTVWQVWVRSIFVAVK